jgi:phosphopantetheinyl transferase
VMALPASIERVVWGRAAQDEESITLNVQRRADGGYDVDALAGNDRLLCLRGYKMIVLEPLPPERRLPEPKGGWPSAVVGEASVDSDPSGVLDQDEIAELRSRGKGQRPAERIAGRVAAKRAVAALMGVHPAAIRISNRESGEPIAEVSGQRGPRISISHRAGQAVAVACMEARVGIDRELVEARARSFAETWFDPREREVLGDTDEGLTVGWAVKEAVLKVLGAGMAVDPRNVQIEGWDGCAVEVRLIGDAAERLSAIGGGALRVNVRIQGVEVVAGALLAA